MATKETAKKTAEKTIKNEVKEITKVPPIKEVPKIPKATTQVPLKKEAPKKNESISKAESISKKTIKNVEAKEIKEVEKETTKEKSFEKRPSAGKQIREMFESILPKLKNEHLEMLTSAEKTKEVLKIRYAFLKEVKNEKDERKINGHARYNKTIVKINDKDYYVTNDLYERNIETFKAWCETIK